jgi:8-oxo-dGTP diphosphatase
MRGGEGPALTVDAVWIHRGRILLVRRGRPPFRGRWALPGGFVEGSETVEEAVRRELKEETGLVARECGIVGVYSGPDRDPRRSTATVAFRMTGRAAAPRGGDDAREAAWVPLREARGLAFDHDRIVADALRAVTRQGGSPHRRRRGSTARRLRRPVRAGQSEL